jgi:hypothetical protein
MLRWHYLQADWNEIPHDPRHLEVPSGASKMTPKPMLHLVQTMHQSCTDTNTISKWTEMTFHMTHVSKEIHRVRPKWFLSPWYVKHKLCTYLSSRLALSPNGPKRASTRASSPRTTIWCIWNDLWAYGTFSQTVHLSCTDTNTFSKWTEKRFQMTLIT